MVKVWGLVLMIASNVVAWHMVLASSSSLATLRSALCKISLFYALWALYNKYLGGRPQELGHISMGSVFISCIWTSRLGGGSFATKGPLLASCSLVVLNFAVVVPMILSMGGPSKFAQKMWKNDPSSLVIPWGYTFLAYMLSNVALWSYACYQIYEATVERGDYEPAEMEEI